mmetsp:Transcript_9078/g.33355  ORF Transcript_9078/g.33355 Transcript_9078/m.33355 type:complete len:158 (+) Transcript_9078:41-514(+)
MVEESAQRALTRGSCCALESGNPSQDLVLAYLAHDRTFLIQYDGEALTWIPREGNLLAESTMPLFSDSSAVAEDQLVGCAREQLVQMVLASNDTGVEQPPRMMNLALAHSLGSWWDHPSQAWRRSRRDVCGHVSQLPRALRGCLGTLLDDCYAIRSL